MVGRQFIGDYGLVLGICFRVFRAFSWLKNKNNCHYKTKFINWMKIPLGMKCMQSFFAVCYKHAAPKGAEIRICTDVFMFSRSCHLHGFRPGGRFIFYKQSARLKCSGQ